jgi:hypothetical protein
MFFYVCNVYPGTGWQLPAGTKFVPPWSRNFQVPDMGFPHTYIYIKILVRFTVGLNYPIGVQVFKNPRTRGVRKLRGSGGP